MGLKIMAKTKLTFNCCVMFRIYMLRIHVWKMEVTVVGFVGVGGTERDTELET